MWVACSLHSQELEGRKTADLRLVWLLQGKTLTQKFPKQEKQLKCEISWLCSLCLGNYSRREGTRGSSWSAQNTPRGNYNESRGGQSNFNRGPLPPLRPLSSTGTRSFFSDCEGHFLLFWERLILACRLILKLGSYQGLELNCQCNLKCLMIMGHIYKNKPVAIVSFELQSVLIAKVASYNGYCSIQYKHRIVFLH